MSEEVPLEKMLHGAFRDEWEFISKHPVFVEHLSKATPTTESYEKLVQVGALLLRQREDTANQRTQKPL